MYIDLVLNNYSVIIKYHTIDPENINLYISAYNNVTNITYNCNMYLGRSQMILFHSVINSVKKYHDKIVEIGKHSSFCTSSSCICICGHKMFVNHSMSSNPESRELLKLASKKKQSHKIHHNCRFCGHNLMGFVDIMEINDNIISILFDSFNFVFYLNKQIKSKHFLQDAMDSLQNSMETLQV